MVASIEEFTEHRPKLSLKAREFSGKQRSTILFIM